MSLTQGARVELEIEKPAAGGRMIARHEGQVVLVLGAIPGERVVASIDRVEKQLAFATTIDVLVPSADRREASVDPRCGGCLYAFISYERQLAIKSDVVRDGFVRLGRIPLDTPVPVAPSPEHGYRMRARFHVKGERVGFYREGTHDLCDAAATAQLLPESFEAVRRSVDALRAGGVEPRAVELSENLAATERAMHVDVADQGPDVEGALFKALEAGGLAGCTARTPDGSFAYAGVPEVADALEVLTGGRAPAGRLARSPESFFQANRHLLPSLVTAVLDRVGPAQQVLDLYAGVGLFSAALAAMGTPNVTAVEGDRAGGADLRRNSAQWPTLRAVTSGVEEYLARKRGRAPDTIIVDPPRTGISKDAMRAIARVGASQVVYVSCDSATMARDARRLIDAGYQMESLVAFDLFPNTPHAEVVGVFRS